MTFDLQAAKARAEAKRAEAPTTPPESEITLVETTPKSPEQIQAEIEQAAAEKAIHDQKVLAFKTETEGASIFSWHPANRVTEPINTAVAKSLRLKNFIWVQSIWLGNSQIFS
jgi:hypothetical protein